MTPTDASGVAASDTVREAHRPASYATDLWAMAEFVNAPLLPLTTFAVTSTLGTFAVDVPAANFYEVTLTMGDGRNYPRDQRSAFFEVRKYDQVRALV